MKNEKTQYVYIITDKSKIVITLSHSRGILKTFQTTDMTVVSNWLRENNCTSLGLMKREEDKDKKF
jgi:hypothetical protein